jgi:hypothetical protein
MLIVQKERKKERKKEKTPGTATTKSLECFVKILELFFWCPILVLVLGTLGFVRKVLPLSLDSLG